MFKYFVILGIGLWAGLYWIEAGVYILFTLIYEFILFCVFIAKLVDYMRSSPKKGAPKSMHLISKSLSTSLLIIFTLVGCSFIITFVVDSENLLRDGSFILLSVFGLILGLLKKPKGVGSTEDTHQDLGQQQLSPEPPNPDKPAG